jgi:hypothetical protein
MSSWTLHDLRRSCVTHMCESPLSVPLHIVELAVNHQSGHRAGVAGTYNHANSIPERREALEKWGKHVTALAKGKKAAA